MVIRGRKKGGKVNPIHFWPSSYRYEVALLAVYSPFLSLAGNEGGGRRWVGWEEKREAAAGGGGSLLRRPTVVLRGARERLQC